MPQDRASVPVRLAKRPPLFPEILNNPTSLLMTNLNQLVGKLAAFPLGDSGRELPAEVTSQGLILWTVIVLKSSHKTIWLFDDSAAIYYSVVCYLLRHLANLLVVRDAC
jgi:hypothetical protein